MCDRDRVIVGEKVREVDVCGFFWMSLVVMMIAMMSVCSYSCWDRRRWWDDIGKEMGVDGRARARARGYSGGEAKKKDR